jgi:hypothetical protein
MNRQQTRQIAKLFADLEKAKDLLDNHLLNTFAYIGGDDLHELAETAQTFSNEIDTFLAEHNLQII